MKKLFRFLSLTVVLLLVISFAACGTYTPPVTDTPGDGTGVIDPGDKPTPEQPEADSFTVTLLWNGDNFTSENSANVDVTRFQAQWTNVETEEKYRAYFNEDGVASIEGLDGDYQVTLASVPQGFTYNPNIYKATNIVNDVSIILYELTPFGNRTGSNPTDDVIQITNPGAYRITLDSADTEIWCYAKPTTNGVYSMESMVDVTANKINPVLYTYFGNSGGYVAYDSEVMTDTGGAENTFTKNFRWEFSLLGNEVGNVFYFRIGSTNIDEDAYPLVVDFIYDRDGDFTSGGMVLEEVVATHDFSTWHWTETPSGTFTYCAYGPGSNGIRLLDADMVGLNPEDGFYHYLVDGEPTGDLLFAKIDQRTEVIIKSFTNKGPGLGTVNVSALNGKSYYNFIYNSYAPHTNADGCYPVTEELRTFLQDYASFNEYFKDGNGYAEIARGDDEETPEYDPFPGYNSDEESMWMFACGYYA